MAGESARALQRDTKLLQVVIFCFQSMQVLVDTDKAKLTKLLKFLGPLESCI